MFLNFPNKKKILEIVWDMTNPKKTIKARENISKNFKNTIISRKMRNI